MNSLLINAVTKQNAMRSFIPFSMVDADVNTGNTYAFLPAVKFGFIDMTGGETPEGLFLSMIQDPQEKLLAYFLTGGTANALTDELAKAIADDDYVIILGMTKDEQLGVCFLVDRYAKQSDIIHFAHMEYPHFKARFSNDEVVEKLYESGVSFLEKETNFGTA